MSSLKPVILGAFGPTTLACIRSWGKAGHAPGLLCVQGERDAPPASAYLAEWAAVPRADLLTPRGLQGISGFLQRFKASGITCIEEKLAVWLHDNRAHLPPGVELWLPQREAILSAMCKAKQSEAAASAGLDVLPTYMLDSRESAAAVNEDHFPFVLRPSQPGSCKPSFKVHIFGDKGKLEAFLAARSLTAPLLGQPFKNLPNTVVHGARTAEGRNFGMAAFVVNRKYKGVTLTLEPIPLQPEIQAKVEAFAEKMGLVGNYHLEFLSDAKAGREWFLEVNMRLGGTTAKALACGYDEPEALLAAYGHGDVSAIAPGRMGALASGRHSLLSCMAATAKGSLTELDYPVESGFQRMAAMLGCMLYCRDEVLSVTDMKGNLAYYRAIAQNALNHLKSRSRHRAGGAARP